MTVPPEAITAAAEAIAGDPRLRELPVAGWSKTLAVVVLDAAAPLLRAEGAAAERDRWQPLVKRIREVALEGGQDARSVRMHIIAILDGADLLRGDS